MRAGKRTRHGFVETHQPRETAAFRGVVRPLLRPLCRFAAYWLRDRTSAEEIVLDTFTHIWQHAARTPHPDFRPGLSVRAVCNRALNRLRDERPAGIFHRRPEPLFTNQALQLEADEMMMLVAEAVSQLPDRCREVFRKSREEGLSNAASPTRCRFRSRPSKRRSPKPCGASAKRCSARDLQPGLSGHSPNDRLMTAEDRPAAASGPRMLSRPCSPVSASAPTNRRNSGNETRVRGHIRKSASSPRRRKPIPAAAASIWAGGNW